MVTEATVNDIVANKTLPVEAGATYVFDLGYYDYSCWAKLDEADCPIGDAVQEKYAAHLAKRTEWKQDRARTEAYLGNVS